MRGHETMTHVIDKDIRVCNCILVNSTPLNFDNEIIGELP